MQITHKLHVHNIKIFFGLQTIISIDSNIPISLSQSTINELLLCVTTMQNILNWKIVFYVSTLA